MLHLISYPILSPSYTVISPQTPPSSIQLKIRLNSFQIPLRNKTVLTSSLINNNEQIITLNYYKYIGVIFIVLSVFYR